MMKKDWKLKVPNLVISVTGGAMSFYLKPNLKKAFAKGLLKVATSTSAWIITGMDQFMTCFCFQTEIQAVEQLRYE